MLFQLTMFPTGRADVSVSSEVSKVIDIIDQSGLSYRLGPMSTSIEGEWDEVMNVINKARLELKKNHDRIYISITVDDRKDATNRLFGKIKSIENSLGREVKK